MFPALMSDTKIQAETGLCSTFELCRIISVLLDLLVQISFSQVFAIAMPPSSIFLLNVLSVFSVVSNRCEVNDMCFTRSFICKFAKCLFSNWIMVFQKINQYAVRVYPFLNEPVLRLPSTFTSSYGCCKISYMWIVSVTFVISVRQWHS